MEVFDPVNADNNVVKDYSAAHRETSQTPPQDALDAISRGPYATPRAAPSPAGSGSSARGSESDMS